MKNSALNHKSAREITPREAVEISKNLTILNSTSSFKKSKEAQDYQVLIEILDSEYTINIEVVGEERGKLVNLESYEIYQLPLELSLILDKMGVIRTSNPNQRIERTFALLRELWSVLKTSPEIIIQKNGPRVQSNISHRKLGYGEIKYLVRISKTCDTYLVNLAIFVDHLELSTYDLIGGFLIDGDESLYIPENLIDTQLLSVFKNSAGLIVKENDFENIKTSLLFPLADLYPMEFSSDINIEIEENPLEITVHLTFDNGKLRFTPIFRYGQHVYKLPLPLTSQSHQYATHEAIILRDIKEEQAFLEFFLSLDVFFKMARNHQYEMLASSAFKKDNLAQIIAHLELAGYKVTGLESIENQYYQFILDAPVIKTTGTLSGNFIDLKINVGYGDHNVDFQTILDAIEKEKNIITLGDKRIGLIPSQLKSTIREWATTMTIDNNGSITIHKANLAVLDELTPYLVNDELKEIILKRKHAILNLSTSTVPLPSSILATLRPYQETGFQYLQIMESAGIGPVLADEMGLGKTLQLIVTIAHLKEKYGAKFSSTLVVCPVSLISNWEAEIYKFAPSITVNLYHGKHRQLSTNADVNITSYNTLRDDIEVLESFYWQAIFLDEAQAIKNPTIKITEAVNRLKSEWRVCCSGTYIENSPMDAYSLFNFLNPGMMGAKNNFQSYFSQEIKKGNTQRMQELKRLLQPLTLRRLKKNVATELAEKIEIPLTCEMSADQAAFYKAHKDSILKKIADAERAGDGKLKSALVLSGIQTLRMLANHPRLVTKEKGDSFSSVKVNTLIEKIQDIIPDHKVLIFSSFVSLLEIVGEELVKNKISYVSLTGKDSVTRRKESIAKFKDPDKAISAFLISIKSGGVGLNLTEADYVFILDPWWNEAVENQAIDRSHRIGQQNTVMAYKMICKDTVEEKVLQIKKQKSEIYSAIVSEDSEALKLIDIKDLEALLL